MSARPTVGEVPGTTVPTGPAPTHEHRGAGRPRDERASRAIAAAALHQLEAVGYAHVSMESVAAEAAVSRATVYRRYRDKADLVTAAIASKVDEPSATGQPLVDLVAYLEDFDARGAGPCVEVVGSLLGAREGAAAMAVHRDRVTRPRADHVRALLARARDLGLLDADVDVDLLLHMLLGAAFARRLLGAPRRTGWARSAVATICSGVATTAGLAHLRASRARRAGSAVGDVGDVASSRVRTKA